MLPVIGMMQHVIGVMLPGVGLMHGNNASYCRVSNPCWGLYNCLDGYSKYLRTFTTE